MDYPTPVAPSKIFLSPSQISRCFLCKEYLSVEPITKTPDSEYICGRCHTQSEGNIADCYNASGHLFLPCRYDIQGCMTFIKYGDVLWHENRCRFKSITCPAVGCDSKIARTNMLLHFRKMHQELILTTREISLSTLSRFENRLYVHNDQILLVQTRISNTFLYIRLTNVQEKHIYSTRLFYRVKLLDKNIPVPLYVCKVPVTEDMLKLNLKLLNTQVYFDIYDRRYEKLTRNFTSIPLTKLRCTICQFYTLPTSYTCTKMHIFCETCEKRLKICNICQTPLKQDKVFSLKYIGAFISIPCCYRYLDCKFGGTPQDVIKHERTFHVFNPTEYQTVNPGQEILLDLSHDSFEETYYSYCQGMSIKFVIKYTKGIRMTTCVMVNDQLDVRLKYDLELSTESRKLEFEGQIVGLCFQNGPECSVSVPMELLKDMDSCGRSKLIFRLIAYR
ncbi:unnamed protein product [Acanthoscelides obtectus]|uniref:SIAH-type domain-containing protein n=1 Tax=Acanthoscelides obtectus TaxID=200917 RepID=A0A9P0P393_ACAOB|nr:unnamed protein product [Acanthoscelides obtectus]CAK1631141.1 hypothetical protein AOBTE_LOCUS6777 [Acanthoscelides obtectus]